MNSGLATLSPEHSAYPNPGVALARSVVWGDPSMGHLYSGGMDGTLDSEARGLKLLRPRPSGFWGLSRIMLVTSILPSLSMQNVPLLHPRSSLQKHGEILSQPVLGWHHPSLGPPHGGAKPLPV